MNAPDKKRSARTQGVILFLALSTVALSGASPLLAALRAARSVPQNDQETKRLDTSQTNAQATRPDTQESVPEASDNASESSEKYIKADHWEKIDNIITATGNVEIHNREIILYADRVVYDETTKDVTADGHVSLIRGSDVFTAEHLFFNMESGLGKAATVAGLVQPQYRFESTQFERKSPDLFELGECRITGCAQPVPRWLFSASRATFLRDEYVEMWNPVFWIKGIPVFYLPYVKYPLGNKRTTGFLMPAIGYSPRKGLTLTQQFYLSLARNMDATFSMDYYSTKGLGGGIEYRYLFDRYSGGRLNAYYFAYRTPLTGTKPDNAVIIRWQHNQTLPWGFKFVAAVDYQNSFDFSREFDNDYMRALIYNRSSQVYLTKTFKWANFSVRLSRFTTVLTKMDLAIVNESFPQISFNTYKRKLIGPVYYSIKSSYNNWQYGTQAQYDKNTQKKSNDLKLSATLSLPFNGIPWFTIDQAATGNVSYFGRSLDPISKKALDVSLFTGNFSYTATFIGPVFYRVYNWTKTGMKIKHLIEPSVTYNYDSPTIDSGQIITTYGKYYRYHYVTYSLTNRVLMKKSDPKAKAKEVFTWGILQSYYLDPENGPYSRYKLKDGRFPEFTDLTNYVRFFPLNDFNLDFRAGYNVYYKSLSSVRAAASFGTAADDFFLSFSWFKSLNPYYSSISSNELYNREQIGVNGGLKIRNLAFQGNFQYNITKKKMLYAGLSTVWNWQCLDLKIDARAFFFRETPEFQIRFSIGLGNITTPTDSLGTRLSGPSDYSY